MILIVGGGIGGLSLAACLVRRGIECELVEREPVWTTTGGGITLYPNGMRALGAVGIRAEVEAAGLPLARIRMLDRGGRLLSEVPGDAWEGVGRTFTVDRKALQRLLLGACDGVRVRLGTALGSIAADARGAEVGFADGSRGSYELVVGADGIRSTVRRLCFDAAPPSYVDQLYWRSAVEADLVACATMMFDVDRYVAVVPLGGGSTYVAFQLRRATPFDDPVERRIERLRERFGDFASPAPEALACLDGDASLHFGRAEEIRIDAWHAGAVALLGDAAHACSPTMAQGGSLAVEDAVVLAEELARASEPRAALERYVARRAPRTRWVRERT
ncbi:MAG TPA: FAD-dependent monooxygenase, partial [Myxococcota bacterium]|nr:FAD-dependent monooxygenase [Myxococcota bacterium]